MKTQVPEQIQDEIDAGSKVLVSVSGGKDSTATCLHLRDLGIPYQAVHMDTGWEHEALYRYVREDLPEHIGPIDIIRAHVDVPDEIDTIAADFEARMGVDYSPMVRLILKKAIFSSRKFKWCTEQLKLVPYAEYVERQEDTVIHTIGVRAQESYKRGQMPEVEWSDRRDGYVWRPILRWTYRDVIDIHQRHAVAPCPLYFGPYNAQRVGCWPCINSRKHEIKRWANDEKRVKIIADLEEVVTHLQRAKIKGRGETIAPNWRPPAFFNGKGGVGATPILDAVEWAIGDDVEGQIDLFAEEASGCVRWGMCDVRSER